MMDDTRQNEKMWQVIFSMISIGAGVGLYAGFFSVQHLVGGVIFMGGLFGLANVFTD